MRLVFVVLLAVALLSGTVSTPCDPHWQYNRDLAFIERNASNTPTVSAASCLRR